jgi:hypothetical protein
VIWNCYFYIARNELFSRHNFRNQKKLNMATMKEENLHTRRHTNTHTCNIRSYLFINIKLYSSLPGYLVMTGTKNHGICSQYLQQRVGRMVD